VTILIGGIAIGAVYALVAVGLTLIFRATGVINFAQGEMLMIGAYSYVLLAQAGMPPLVQMAGAVLAGVLLGLIFFFVTGVLLRKAAEITVVIGTLAISILLQAGARLRYTDNPMRSEPWIFGDRDVSFGGTTLSINSFTIIAVTVLIGVGLYVWFSRSLYGKAMRAVAEDTQRAALTGIPVRSMLLLSWIVGGVVAAIAGALLSPVTGVFPAMGATVLFPAFIAAALGGFESVTGSLIGGVLLGVLQTLAVVVVGGVFRDGVTFAVLLAVLIWRPQGLFASAAQRTH
jgi:branched-chain amino acid transport system permease protein